MLIPFPFFVRPTRPTHLHEREGDGKRNILLGWPILTLENAGLLQSLISRRPPGASLKKRQSASPQEGRKHLGAALGSRSYLEQYVNGKVEEWVGQVTKLAEFALSQPQACYAAFTYGLKHRWTYFLRTLPDLEDILAPLERVIADVLIPSITGHYW